MKHILLASHAHFADGLLESLELLSGKHEELRALSLYVDGKDDAAAEVNKLASELPKDDELIIFADLFGGSVHNEFVRLIRERPNTYLVSNMNLPLVLQFVLDPGEGSTPELLARLLADPEIQPKYVNQLLDSFVEDDDDF